MTNDVERGPTRPLSDTEEAKVQAMIVADPDSPELTEAQFAQSQPFAEAFPEMAEALRRSRGIQRMPTKEQVSIRLDRDILEHFQSSGPGWQARINDLLRQAIG